MSLKPKNHHIYAKILLTFLISNLIFAACGPAKLTTQQPSPTPASSKIPANLPMSQGKCGDGVCEGPENEKNCPADCTASPTAETTISTSPSVTTSSVCSEPNPQRASIQDLVEWRNWLDDGGFEAGKTEVVIANSSQNTLSLAQAERSREAARSGAFGYILTAGANQGLIFSIRSYLDKGEGVRFSFWARSPNGEIVLQPTVTWVERGQENKPGISYTPDQSFRISSEWTQVSFETENTQILRYALLNIEIGPNMTLHIDDVQVEQELWRMAEYAGESRIVGGIPVPLQPVAPTHISFLIHIEDPSNLQMDERYFQDRTAVFTELAKILDKHGGFLTIQPEEDWVMGSDQFTPGLLQELAEQYGVQYSTHTHGPHCRDDEGRLRSYTDCNQNKDTAGWDFSVNDYDYPAVVDYVGNLQNLISEAAGIPVSDHNGNWEFAQATELSQVGVQTWTAYKNWRTQRTYPILINNPWRPSPVSADAELDQWLTHDPSTDIIYIPGWGQTLTRWHERAQEKLAPILSQWIYYADPERVNTLTVMLHVGIFDARYEQDDATYTVFNPTSGTLTLSEEFKTQMAYWDKLLTELVDPLVAEGYLQWTSLPEMGNLFQQWEQENCGTATSSVPVTNPQPETSMPNYEPPINIFLILHIDPEMDLQTDTFKVTPEVYQRTYDEIDWLMAEADRHDLQFTALFNGWYPKYALEQQDLSQFRNLLAAGHDVGSHAHRLTYDEEQDLWIAHVNELSKYGRPNYDPELTLQAWDDAYRYVDAVLTGIGATEQNQVMCAVPFMCSDEGQLMNQFGFTIAAGGRSEKSTSYFGHIVWNPWRPASNDEFGHELEDDLHANFIYLDHLAQIGIIGGAHGMDLSVPQLQRRFLMLYTEWLNRERTGTNDMVWTFGFVYHPNYGDRYNAELVEFLAWLDTNFVGKVSTHGNIIAQYADISDIAQQFYSWEAENPGKSSFSYVLNDPYPYTYEIVPRMLENAAYEANVDLGQAVTCFRLSKDGQPIYLLWSNAGEQTVDFSSQLNGQVLTTDAAGVQSIHEGSSLHLTEEPLFVEPNH
jgi:hypothetical protein